MCKFSVLFYVIWCTRKNYSDSRLLPAPFQDFLKQIIISLVSCKTQDLKTCLTFPPGKLAMDFNDFFHFAPSLLMLMIALAVILRPTPASRTLRHAVALMISIEIRAMSKYRIITSFCRSQENSFMQQVCSSALTLVYVIRITIMVAYAYLLYYLLYHNGNMKCGGSVCMRIYQVCILGLFSVA